MSSNTAWRTYPHVCYHEYVHDVVALQWHEFNAEALLHETLCVRLSKDFQLVSSGPTQSASHLSEGGPFFLSLGHQFHRVQGGAK